MSNERGATFTEYALILALLVVATMASIGAIEVAATGLLDDSGDDIGTPRPYDDDLQNLTVKPAPAWAATTTTPPGLLTYVDKSIRQFDGTCLSFGGGPMVGDVCGGPNEAKVSALSEDGVLIELYVDATTCLVADPLMAPPTVRPAPCGTDLGRWRESGVSGSFVTYVNDETGMCLTPFVPASPDGLLLATCDGRAEQRLEVLY
ncbi:MAG: hypothetical protein AAGD35_05085 [Actinomycetota bacterium]